MALQTLYCLYDGKGLKVVPPANYRRNPAIRPIHPHMGKLLGRNPRANAYNLRESHPDAKLAGGGGGGGPEDRKAQ